MNIHGRVGTGSVTEKQGRIPDMTNQRSWLSLPGLIVLAVHTFLVLCMLVMIAVNWHYGSGEGVMLWFLIYGLDFPSSWLSLIHI